MKTKKQSRLMVIFLSFLICMSLMPTTAFAAPGELEINEGNFPDANFRKYVSEKCDTDSNGSLSQNELYKVSSIIIPNGNIATIKGVEHFTNLKTLSLPGNQLTAVDLSKNLALKSLTITDNQLTTLDVSKNQLLKLIHCSGNNLTDLNVTNNLELGVLVCSGNNLTALDVSKNPKLVQINCSGNKLTALDVSKNPQLMLMDCSHNQLTSLDITANEEIIEFKGKDQKYDIEVDESTLTFDLKSLPEGFDKSKVISWTGGTASGDTLKIDSDKPSQVIYTYQAKPNNNLSVTLNVTYKEKVNITFESNGGTGSMPKVTKNAGETYTLPECGFTAPENQEFDTWEIDGKKVAPGTEIKVEKDTVVKATWRDIMVDINFEPGEGSGNMDQETVKKGSTFKLPPNKFEAPENKEFKGWKIGDKEYAPNA
ncbi:MAG: InlB B-repeat-containing protein, partial [Clostridiales bacterium]|nr:InlB B-repeat-containing protein [Clostridiales bacterium]MDY6117146.1 InlB B-repeat-containing protein [Anaerovoracaceae bacterium]